VPRISEDMKLRYLQRRKSDLASLAQAFDSGDYEMFCMIGHQLKGNATTFGFDELEKIARELEVAGKSESRDEARRSLDSLELWLSTQE
jgi:HPt (histidine-containing phosphotransfer) domain-containing protein